VQSAKADERVWHGTAESDSGPESTHFRSNGKSLVSMYPMAAASIALVELEGLP
jgi:hypothetical protein